MDRKYSSKNVWDIVKDDKITTKLVLENETDWVNCVQYEMMTEEEKMLSGAYAEKLMDDSNDDTDDIDQMEDMVEFNPSSMISRDGEECSDEKGEDETKR